MRRSANRVIRELRRIGYKLTGNAPPTAQGSGAAAHATAVSDPTFWERKARKLDRIRPLLHAVQPPAENPTFFDFLTEELRVQYDIADTDNVSSHDYDSHAQRFIRDYQDGLILDCGAGLRRVYYDNVVNFEICSYPTTDVRGVGEQLPFKDGVFDGVFSFNVLEHVKDPFGCAKEIARVLKPGGRLYCVVPFLQPFHAYPHHYYNMTHMGLRNLFADTLDAELQEVNAGGQPIFTLTWFLQHWLQGLPPKTRRQMKRMRVADLARSPFELWQEPFVTQLSAEKTLELASTTSLFAKKRAA